jgi:hypothetical protein
MDILILQDEVVTDWCKMNKYIFLSTEGSTFQPNSESIEPDINNLQVIGFAKGDTPAEAMKELVKENRYLSDTNFDEIIGIRLANNKRNYYSLKMLSTNNST